MVTAMIAHYAGRCCVCYQPRELVFGACFDCADSVAGQFLGDGLHKLWDSRQPSNMWLVRERRDGSHVVLR